MSWIAADDETSLENWRTQYLGRSGALTEHMRSIGQLSADDRPAAGQAANAAKTRIESAYAERKSRVEELALDRQLEAERIDVTLPPRKLHNRVRALSPHIGARGLVNGRRVLVWRTRVVDGELELLEVQPEGKRRMTYEEFTRGLR